jgi:hypothetical protein
MSDCVQAPLNSQNHTKAFTPYNFDLFTTILKVHYFNINLPYRILRIYHNQIHTVSPPTIYKGDFPASSNIQSWNNPG